MFCQRKNKMKIGNHQNTRVNIKQSHVTVSKLEQQQGGGTYPSCQMGKGSVGLAIVADNVRRVCT